MKVLLIDDELSFIEQTKLFLEKEKEDFDVEILTDPTKAIEMIKEDRYDAVVSDYQMPEVDGLELLKKIKRKLDFKIPFIFFTGKGREEVAMKALNLGADVYLKKGGDPKSQYGVLAESIEQQVDHYRTKEYLRKTRLEYKNLIDSISDMLFVHDFECNIIMVNQTAVELLEFKEEQLEGMSLGNILDLKQVEIIKDLIEEIDEDEELVFEGKIQTKSDNKIPVEISTSNITYRDEKRILSVIRDISERKRAVKQLHKIIKDYNK